MLKELLKPEIEDLIEEEQWNEISDILVLWQEVETADYDNFFHYKNSFDTNFIILSQIFNSSKIMQNNLSMYYFKLS